MLIHQVDFVYGLVRTVNNSSIVVTFDILKVLFGNTVAGLKMHAFSSEK